jgi:murein DD-endopeptidase MepM/ murein hydrolase activator NlpD
VSFVSVPFRRRTTISSLIATVAAAMTMVLVATPVMADPQDDKARVDRELARTRVALETASDRVASAAIAFEEANRRLPQVKARLADARSQLAAARVAAAAAARRAEAAAKDLSGAEAGLKAALRRVDRARDDISEYAVSAYKGRDIAGVDALLRATNPADFVAGFEYLQRVAQGQQRALTELTQARGEAENHRSVQADKAGVADDARRAADDALRRTAAAAQEAYRAERDMAALVSKREQALTVAREERAATLARYKELQAESARIAAEIRALAKGGGPIFRPGATLPMPVNGWKSSDFGMRYHPIYHEWRMHTGVDLSAPGGAPIWAVAAGKVIRAGWNGGYGNFTCIYHGLYQGKGFASCYAHQSAIGVKIGQQVRTGQVIGRVGTTGTSTGNHLHFEIRLNGDPVDPWPWLT